MPKSRKRKGAKSYRPKPIGSVYSVPEPLALFRLVGNKKLEPDEEEAACLLLLNTMGEGDPATKDFFASMGVTWPPTTTDEIRSIAKLLVERDREEAARAATN